MNNVSSIKSSGNRRSFLRKGLAVAGTAAASDALLARNSRFAEDEDEDSGQLTRGDAAILRFF